MDLTRPRSWLCPVTIGRQAELRLIQERLRRPQPGTVLILGEAGIGKTRLAGEAAAEAVKLGYRVVRAQCDDAHTGLPFAPIRELLRGLGPAYPPDAIAHLAAPYAPALGSLMPELATDTGARTAPSLDKGDLFDAVDRVVAGVVADAPLAVVVEDLHWCDAASLELLRFLARRSFDRPLALILTCRDDEIGPDLEHTLADLERTRLALEVPLRGLDPSDVDAMLRATLGLSRPAPAELIHLLSMLTGGNPFFIEEVLPSLGVDWTRPGAGPPLTRADTLRIPRSVHDAVHRRAAALSPTARRLLDLAAVAGIRFRADLVRELAGLGEAALIGALKELTDARLLVEETANRFAFRHALTRQAVYRGLLARERQALHRRVAAMLEDSAGDDEVLPDLAYHAHAAGDWERARRHARRAGDQAMALHAPHAAVEHYTRAMEATRHLAMPPDSALIRARGEAFELLGDFEAALDDDEAALDRARATGDRIAEVEALLSLGQLWTARDYTRAGEAFREALAIAQATNDDDLTARCLNRLGNWHLNALRPREARDCHRQALAIVQLLGDRPGEAETLDLLGLAAFLAGDLREGTALDTRAVALWRELDDRRGLASSLLMMAMGAPSLHTDTVPAVATLAEGLAIAEEAIATTRAIGWRAGECWARWVAGGLLHGARGGYAAAFDELHVAGEIAAEIEHVQWAAAIHCMLGRILTDLCAPSRARRELEQALELARALRSPYWTQSATGWLAAAAVAAGDLAGAEAVLQAEQEPRPAMDSIAGRLWWRAAAELALARGEAELALELLDQLLAAAPPATDGQPVATLDLLRGRALAALGRTTEAEALLVRARDAAALGARPLVWRAETELHRLYRAQGRADEAGAAAHAARELIEALAAEVPDAELRAGFLASATLGLPARRDPAETLTPREREVAGLIARGYTNREIADALYITQWTAATHVRNILAKLGQTSRAQVAAWATANGLAG